jgi:hypothetical protein
LWGNIKQADEVLELLLFLEQISQWLGVHRKVFERKGGNNLQSQEYFAHAWLT